MTMNIRQATIADSGLRAELVEDVQQLHADMLRAIYKPVMSEAAFVDDIENRLLVNPDVWVYIAEVDGKAAGSVVVMRSQRPATPYTFERDYLSVDQISVKPAYQGQGIGRALMQVVFDRAKSLGISRVSLHVAHLNTAAIGFYEQLGFEMLMHQMTIDLANEKV